MLGRECQGGKGKKHVKGENRVGNVRGSALPDPWLCKSLCWLNNFKQPPYSFNLCRGGAAENQGAIIISLSYPTFFQAKLGHSEELSSKESDGAPIVTSITKAVMDCLGPKVI